MDYKKAWEELRLSLLARGENFFFLKGDDEHSVYVLGEKTIKTTLDQMDALEDQINKYSNSQDVIKLK